MRKGLKDKDGIITYIFVMSSEISVDKADILKKVLKAMLKECNSINSETTVQYLDEEIKTILIYMRHEPATIIGAKKAIDAWGESLIHHDYMYDELKSLRQLTAKLNAKHELLLLIGADLPKSLESEKN